MGVPARQSSEDSAQSSRLFIRRIREALMIFGLALALVLLLALISYQSSDPGWSHIASQAEIRNWTGRTGAWCADLLLYLWGTLAYLFPVLLGYAALRIRRGPSESSEQPYPMLAIRFTGMLLTLGAGCGLATLHLYESVTHLPMGGGGLLGQVLSDSLVNQFNFLGATLVLLALFLTGLTLLTGLSWLTVMDLLGAGTLWLQRQLWQGITWSLAQWRRWRQSQPVVAESNVEIKTADNPEPSPAPSKRQRKKLISHLPPRIEPSMTQVETSERAQQAKQTDMFETVPMQGELPSLALLDAAVVSQHRLSEDSLQALSRLLELKLADFGVQVEVVAVYPGPVVTRFEVQPAPGLKASKITGLSRDLARSMSVVSVRVVEVIPGKSYVGIEIPNEQRDMVSLRDVLASKAYDDMKSPLTLGLGKDIAGQPVVANLAKMPHLLVAGTTGSGKSVGVNAMLVSMLYKATPDDVRLIMIDPKMLELAIYDGIPHLLAPVVTDMKEAANALRWCVAEMERRYKLMAAFGVRNIAGFNRKVSDGIKNKQPLTDPLWQAEDQLDQEPPELEPLPYIVVVIDEFADMMMVVGKKVEELIARIAQKARAAGIHLILATQRPSVDVITGLIKANIPTRIAFQVSSKIDSRTILDQQGAETLLGQGDMLYLPPGTGTLTRVHGAFVDDHEVHNVVEAWKQHGQPDYIEAIVNGGETTDWNADLSIDEGGDSEADPLYDQAVRIVTESRRASISGVQRRLKIGYNRAARLVEAMQEAGVVSAPQSNGNREVLAPPPVE